MDRRELGGQGLRVSAVGLGCLNMSDLYTVPEESQSIATIHRAIELGIDLLDTADSYGPHTNEELVGRAIRDRRESVVVATKFGFIREPEGKWLGLSGHPEYVHEACDSSLRRLGLDYIDLYQQHRIDPDVPIEETVGAMSELVESGKVRFIGLSEADPDSIRRAHRVHPITSVQTEYSLWSREPEDGVLDTTRKLGIGFLAYSPLSRGFLTGAIRSTDDFGPHDYRHTLPRFQGANFLRNLGLVDLVQRLASARGVTVSQLVLAWLLCQRPNIVPIPGTANPIHLEENAASAGLVLTEDELAQIEGASPAVAVAGDRYPEVDVSRRLDS